MNALFVVNWEKEHVAETVSLWTRAAIDLGIQPVFLKSDQAQVTFTQPVRVTDVPAAGEIDLVLTFGGDGTMIRALDRYAGLGCPFLGINLGRMGFLLEADADSAEPALEAIVEACRSG